MTNYLYFSDFYAILLNSKKSNLLPFNEILIIIYYKKCFKVIRDEIRNSDLAEYEKRIGKHIMCGIAGIIGQISNNQYRIKRMINIINHRGPDASGFYCDNFIALGHARLRIIDLDQKADQPMFNADKSIVVVFNGEIYNYKELKKRLSFYPYKSKSDTEVILAAYEKWGTDCVQYLKGMFAFVIYDKKNNLIFGARDRFGIKPFYYYKEGDNLFFASEIKSILSQIKEISPNHFIMMKWFLGMDIDHLNETFFKNVYQLLPGESFYFKNNTLFLKRYYDIKDHIHVRNNFKEHYAIEACKELFTKSIKEHMQSDVPVGIYFSGGLDSTAIVGVLKKVLKYDSLFTLTAVSNSVSQYEKDILLRMAEKLGIDAYFCDTNNIDPEKFLYRTMWHMEMPFSISNVCDDILNKAARDQNITGVIEGQGSDEAQAGYYHHYKAFLMDLLLEGKMLKFYDNFKNAKWPNKIGNLKKE